MRTHVLLTLLLAPGLSGCLEGFGVGDELGEVVIEARILHGANQTDWAEQATLEVEAPPVKAAKGAISEPGGGRSFTLDVPHFNGTVIEFRVVAEPHVDLARYEADWVLQRFSSGQAPVELTRRANEVVRMDAGPGLYTANVIVGKGLKFDASQDSARVAIDLAWYAESSVYPFRTQGSPRPANYDQMADVFTLEAPVARGSLEATTGFRGDYAPGNGTDVDLEAYAEAEPADATCSARGSTVATTASAEEFVALDIREAAVHVVRVGSVSASCGEDSYYYNTGPVPYWLEVRIAY